MYIAHLFKTNLKAAFALKWGFVFNGIVAFFNTFVGFASFLIIFHKYETINGYNIYDVSFLTGVIILIYAPYASLFYGVSSLVERIEKSELDGYFIQPRNLWLNIACSHNDPTGVVEFFTGLVFLIFSGYITLANLPIFLFMLLLGQIIFISFLSIIASLAFFIRSGIYDLYRIALIIFVTAGGKPRGMFAGFVKVAVWTVIPAGMITFVPIDVIKGDFSTLPILIIASIIFSFTAVLVFNFGLKRYNSGNGFYSHSG